MAENLDVDQTGVRSVLDLGDEILTLLARKLDETGHNSATIDWNNKESVKEKMRSQMLRLLARYNYPPDQEDQAVEAVLK